MTNVQQEIGLRLLMFCQYKFLAGESSQLVLMYIVQICQGCTAGRTARFRLATIQYYSIINIEYSAYSILRRYLIQSRLNWIATA